MGVGADVRKDRDMSENGTSVEWFDRTWNPVVIRQGTSAVPAWSYVVIATPANREAR